MTRRLVISLIHLLTSGLLAVAGGDVVADDQTVPLVSGDAAAVSFNDVSYAPDELELAPGEKPKYRRPVPSGNVYFAESFDYPTDDDFRKRWILSQARKDLVDKSVAKYDGQWSIERAREGTLAGDLGLVLKTKAKHHAVSVKFDKPFHFTGKTLMVQYEVKFQKGLDCGGAYMKLLTADDNMDLATFNDRTPYTIMFGPDKCGNDFRLHFIFRHKNPLTGAFEEKHAKKSTVKLDKFFTDKNTHLYTLVVTADNRFEVYVDQSLVNNGSLLQDMSPPVNPPLEVVDPTDHQPSDWDEREKIPDASAVKPDSWDEPEFIDDPHAVKPDGWLKDEAELVANPKAKKPRDWDNNLDGEWEPPMINNPKCEWVPGCGEWKAPQIKNPRFKGKWTPPLISNPNYKGKWKPRMMPNPNYFEDKDPYRMSPIGALGVELWSLGAVLMLQGALGLELWSMTDSVMFDNLIVTDNKLSADRWAEAGWAFKLGEERAIRAAQATMLDALLEVTEERPWLWAVMGIVFGLPVFMLLIYCCLAGSRQDEMSRRKKSDAYSPDQRLSPPSERTNGREGKARGWSSRGGAEQRLYRPAGLAEGEDAGGRRRSNKSCLEGGVGLMGGPCGRETCGGKHWGEGSMRP